MYEEPIVFESACELRQSEEILFEPSCGNTTASEDVIYMSTDLIMDIIQSVPTPVEATSLIKDQGISYDPSVMHEAKQASNYATTIERAINLGAYSTDLSYANLQGQNQDALNYLSAAHTLAIGLDLDQFFDYEAIKDLVDSPQREKDILQELTQSFESANLHLQENHQEELASLIVVGAWLEGLHLTCQMYEKHQKEVLKEKIGEQKIVLGQLILVLDVYRYEPDYATLLQELKKLQAVYDEIEIKTTFQEHEMIILEGGELQFIDKSTSVIEISEAQTQKITQLVSEIRGLYLK